MPSQVFICAFQYVDRTSIYFHMLYATIAVHRVSLHRLSYSLLVQQASFWYYTGKSPPLPFFEVLFSEFAYIIVRILPVCTNATGPSYTYLPLNTYIVILITAMATNIKTLQLNVFNSTGVDPGQKHQKNAKTA